jgi:two-component system LytT family response regulator
VFVTAYDAYALRAFDVSAVDYLLKPFDRERFERALARALARLAAGDRPPVPADAPADAPADPPADAALTPELEALLAYLRDRRGADVERPAYATRFVVRAAGKLHFVRAADVDWIDTEGNYVRLHARGRAHLVRDTLSNVQARLDPAVFVRVHRSAIINVDRVAALEPYFHGEYVITMTDGAKLTSSRSYSGQLRALLG